MISHKAMDGEPVPGTFAAEDELFGIGRALKAAGGAVFELAPTGADGQDVLAGHVEVDWMARLSTELDLPVSFALLEVRSHPDLWRELMERSIEANEQGARLVPQIPVRPFGMLIGFGSNHPFAKRPTFKQLNDSLPYERLIDELRKPEVREAILTETDLPADPTQQFDGLPGSLQHMATMLYFLGDIPDYEPTETLASRAQTTGVDPMSLCYDTMLERDGQTFLLAPFFGYAHEDHDAIREMMLHPAGVSGLSDGGAHCRMICDVLLPRRSC